MTDEPQIITDTATAAPPPQSSDTAIRNIGIELMGNDGSENASDYIAERNAQDAEERGEDIQSNPTKQKERAERYKRALESARQSESGIPSPATNTPDYSQQYQEPEETREQYGERIRQRASAETAFSMRYGEFINKNPGAVDDMAVVEYFQPASHVADVILHSEYGPALAHELAKVPEAVFELNDLPPHEVARCLGVVEGRLREREANEAYAQQYSVPQRRQTRAPAPLSTVRGGASPSVSLEDASMADYVKTRRNQDKADR